MNFLKFFVQLAGCQRLLLEVGRQVEEFLDDWLPGMHSDVLMVGVNWTPDLEGQEMEPLDLLEEFESELD